MKQTINAILKDAVEKTPHLNCVMAKRNGEWQGLTFTEVAEHVKNLAGFFLKQHYPKNSKIAIFAEGSPEWMITELAAFHTSLIAVPLAIRLNYEELLFRLDHAEVIVLAMSSNTLNQALPLVGKTKRPFKIFWIDHDRRAIDKAMQENALLKDMVVFYTTSMKDGQEWLENAHNEQLLREADNAVQPDDCATITYSSGTTGNPKGVMLSHRNYYANSASCMDMLGIGYGKAKTLLILPCDHAFGHTVGFYATLFRSMTIYFIDAAGGLSAMARNISSNIFEVKPTFILVVPALATNMIKKVYSNIRKKGKRVEYLFEKALNASIAMYGDGYNPVPFSVKFKSFWAWFFLGKLIFFPQVRKALPIEWMIGGGALFDIKTQQFFAAIGIPLHQGYGLSETSPVVTSNLPLPRQHKIGTAGVIFRGNEVRILTSNGEMTMAPNVKGEILVRGDNVMLGYYKNPEQTAKAIQNGWLHTGDMGILDDDGFLHVIGREKALLIAKDGEKYNPEEMEEAIRATSNDIIDQCLLYCDHKPYVTGLVVLNKEEVLSLYRANPAMSTDDLLQKIIDTVYAFKTDKVYGNMFQKIWMPATFAITFQPFETNSSMKIVRYQVFERMTDTLSYLYTEEGSRPLNIENKKQLESILNK
jgi:long-chain acyl-CoA synthetase